MSHKYQNTDMMSCLADRHLVFIGDSTVRQLYWAALRRLDADIGKKSLQDFARLDDRHINLAHEVHGVHVDFIWDPWLNSTALFGQLARFRHRPGNTASEVLALEEKRQSAALIVLGTPGLWAAQNERVRHLHVFRDGINTVLHWLRGSISDNIFLSPYQTATDFGRLPNHVVLIPVTEPAWDKITPERQAMMTPQKIEKMNWNLQNSDAIDYSHILWSFNAMTHGRRDTFLGDGIHVTDQIADSRLDVLLNLRCNIGIAQHSHQNELTCCVPYPRPSKTQILLLGLAIMGLPWLALDKEQDEAHSAWFQRSCKALTALSGILTAAALCFLADRTHLFGKQEKELNMWAFLLSLFVLLVLLLLSARRVVPATSTEKGTDNTDFLSRAQTDEWKGWMQGFLLLYNFHGASESSGWYRVLRLLLSMYIFLSCYGHTRYFLRTGDFSVRRVLRVLCRINLLSIVLVFTMSSSWTLYSFCPITTLWFLTTYLTLSTLPHLNTSLSGLILKILVVSVATTLLINTRGVLGGFLLAFETSIGVTWDLETVRHHLAVDQFTPYLGVLTAAIAHRSAALRRPAAASSKPSISNASDTRLDRLLSSMIHPEVDAIPVVGMISVFSCIALLMFLVLAFEAQDRRDNNTYNSYHPYITPWLVLAAVILRNRSPSLRNIQVTGATALGRLSLEVSMLQYHIFLAGDATAILRITSSGSQGTQLGKILENSQTAVLLVVLLSASLKCHSATRRIMDMLGPRTGDEGKKHKVEEPLTGSDV